MPVELGQTQQCADELTFSLYQRVLHPELFQIYQARRIDQRLYHAEVWLTGLSHVVSVQFRDQNLTEVVSQPSELHPRVGLASSFRFRGERDFSQSFAGGVKYILSTQVEKMTSNLFPATYRDLARDTLRRGMSWEGEDAAQDGLKPFSLLDFEARECEFHVHAFHVFPADRAIVKTQSIFETEKKPRPKGF